MQKDAPSFIGLSALRLAAQVGKTLTRIPADRQQFLFGAGSTPEPQREGYALTAKWPRRATDRWTLAMAGDDITRAVGFARATAPVQQEKGDA